MSDEAGRGTVLVAEDDDGMRRLLARAVGAEGHATLVVANGDDAVRAFSERTFDLIVSDIDMPGKSGIELLRSIRERDLDVPVVLITGGPTLETAIAAIEHGASHYLTKPVDVPRLQSIVRRAMQEGRLARLRRRLAELGGDHAHQIADLAGLRTHFEKALAELHMVFQPIVQWSSRSTYAQEALVRSSEPTLSHPEALFDAAERLDCIPEVGRRVRAICARTAHGADGFLLFVNLHTSDLLDEQLFQPEAPLTRIAGRVVLEITERARLEDVSDAHRRIAELRRLGFRVAIDDLGAGYAGLMSFVSLEPDYMKLDMSLVRGLHQSKIKRELVGAMIQACGQLDIQVIGEGVENAAERDALVGLGCNLLQGYLFARPARAFVAPDF